MDSGRSHARRRRRIWNPTRASSRHGLARGASRRSPRRHHRHVLPAEATVGWECTLHGERLPITIQDALSGEHHVDLALVRSRLESSHYRDRRFSPTSAHTSKPGRHRTNTPITAWDGIGGYLGTACGAASAIRIPSSPPSRNSAVSRSRSALRQPHRQRVKAEVTSRCNQQQDSPLVVLCRHRPVAEMRPSSPSAGNPHPPPVLPEPGNSGWHSGGSTGS